MYRFLFTNGGRRKTNTLHFTTFRIESFSTSSHTNFTGYICGGSIDFEIFTFYIYVKYFTNRFTILNFIDRIFVFDSDFYPPLVNTTIVTNFYYRNTIHNEMSDSFRTLMFDVLPSMLKLKPRQESIQNNPELCYQSRKSSKYMELEQALNDIRYIALHLNNESNRNDWKYVAIVVDRFQFLVFTSINFIGSIALLLQVNKFVIFFSLFS